MQMKLRIRTGTCSGLVMVVGLSAAGMPAISGPERGVALCSEVDPAAGVSLVQQSEPEILTYPGEAKEDAVERKKHPLSFHPERMSVKPPGRGVPLGNPVRLTVVLAPGKVVALAFVQSTKQEDLDSGIAKVVQDNGLTKTIEIVPRELGPVDVMVQAVYLDNAIVRQTVRLDVVPSTVGLKRFVLNQGVEVLTLVLGNDEGAVRIKLSPIATYESLEFPLYPENFSHIELTVEQDEKNPVIRVDKDGFVYAFREGKAVLTGDFAGVKDKIRVTVYSKQNAPPR